MKTVAELIDELFKTHRRPDGREYTYLEVAEALKGRIDPGNISRLRTGKNKDPRRETLLALCQFFKVPGSYFFPELEPIPTTSPEEEELSAVTRASTSEAIQRKVQELIAAIKKEVKNE